MIEARVVGRGIAIAALVTALLVVGQASGLYRVDPIVVLAVLVPAVLGGIYAFDAADRFAPAAWPPPPTSWQATELSADRRVRELGSLLEAAREGEPAAQADLARQLARIARDALVRRGAGPEDPWADLDALVAPATADYLRGAVAGRPPALSRRALHGVLADLAALEDR